MENLNKLQDLTNTAYKLEESIKTYKNVYQKDTKHYDKIGYCFNSDNRFAAHKGLTIRLDTWKGVYGNSSCSTIVDLDNEIFNKHLLKVISGKQWEILEAVIESIKTEARTLKKNAKKELEEKLEKVNAL